MDIKRTSNRNSELETFVNIEDLKARDTILKTIKEHSLFSPGDHIVMGLSGGPDSLCLFDVLFEEKDELGIELTAVQTGCGRRGSAFCRRVLRVTRGHMQFIRSRL